jgi:hypothetical protein
MVVQQVNQYRSPADPRGGKTIRTLILKSRGIRNSIAGRLYLARGLDGSQAMAGCGAW